MQGNIVEYDYVMDDEMIGYVMQEVSAKRSKKVNTVLAVASVVAGDVDQNTVVAGINASGGLSGKTVFKRAKSVKNVWRHERINIWADFGRQDYRMQPEQFDFVWNYITARCTQAKIKG